MLGRFLELSLPATDIAATWQRWLSLGFAAAEAGDVWSHPYGVVACEGLALGLHARTLDEPCLTFTQSGVEELEQELSNRLIGIERSQLGAEVFNLLELREPGGMLLRVQEARSFSGPAEPPRTTALGRFRSLSLPAADLGEACGFWERLGMELRDTDEPWEGVAINGLPLACHDREILDRTVLLFELAGDDLDDEALRNEVFGNSRTVPVLRSRRHRLLRAPEGLALLLLDPAD